MTQTHLLAGEDVAKIVAARGVDRLMDEMIGMLRNSCLTFDPEQCQIPVRDGFHYEEPFPGLLEWMPLLQTGDRILLKMVGYHPTNPAAFNLPTILCTLALFDARSGRLLAIADGTFLTALRTAAASAVASQVLAHPESRSLGVIGCGAQSVAQAHALSRSFYLDEILAYDIDADSLRSFEDRLSFLGLPVRTFKQSTLARLVEHSDILVTATSIAPGEGPVFEHGHHRPHLHVNAVGSDFPGKTELPLGLLERSLVCPDFSTQATAEGECQQMAPSQIGPDLPELVGNANRYLTHQNSPTVFDSTGWALEDLIALTILLEHATELRIGRRIQFESAAYDPKNPYDFGQLPAPVPPIPASREFGQDSGKVSF